MMIGVTWGAETILDRILQDSVLPLPVILCPTVMIIVTRPLDKACPMADPTVLLVMVMVALVMATEMVFLLMVMAMVVVMEGSSRAIAVPGMVVLTAGVVSTCQRKNLRSLSS